MSELLSQDLNAADVVVWLALLIVICLWMGSK